MIATLLVASFVTPRLQDPDFEVRTPRGVIRLRNFGNIEVTDEGLVKAATTGTPASIEDTERGLILVGKSIRVTLRRLPKGYAVESADIEGEGQVTYDTKVAFEALSQSSETKPTPPSSFEVTKLTSETINYSTKDELGVLRMTSAMNLTSHSAGKVSQKSGGDIPFVQDVNFQGTSGEFVVGTVDGVLSQMRGATVNGPVKFNLLRTEQVLMEGKSTEQVTQLTGSTDLLVADLDGPQEPNLTAKGNVKFTGDGAGFVGKVTGSQATIFVSNDFKPIRYQFTGTPATTRVTVGGGK